MKIPVGIGLSIDISIAGEDTPSLALELRVDYSAVKLTYFLAIT